MNLYQRGTGRVAHTRIRPVRMPPTAISASSPANMLLRDQMSSQP
jgi:hypothetical protein